MTLDIGRLTSLISCSSSIKATIALAILWYSSELILLLELLHLIYFRAPLALVRGLESSVLISI